VPVNAGLALVGVGAFGLDVEVVGATTGTVGVLVPQDEISRASAKKLTMSRLRLDTDACNDHRGKIIA
jgi:hypothetical protein